MQKYRTVRDVIGYLEDVKCFREPIHKDGEVIYNHFAGRDWRYSLDRKTGKYHFTRINTFKYRLRWDRLSFTLIAKWGYTHPSIGRAISIRESAELQTFPRDFLFDGSLSAMYRVIGNAVPPMMAKAIAGSVKEMLE